MIMNEINPIAARQETPSIKERAEKSPVAHYFKEVVYGGVDGIVTTFAVVSGFSGAALSSDITTQLSFAIVLLFGLANLFADAVSMGLGNFLSVHSEKDRYNILREREREALKNNPNMEREETIEIMREKGFSEEDAAALTSIYSKNEEYWLDFMMANEHDLSDPRGDNPILTGLATFGSFIFFGAIPILPFVFLSDLSVDTIFQVSATGTFLALAALGLMKWWVIGTALLRSLGEIILVGGTASIIAFAVGTFFKL